MSPLCAQSAVYPHSPLGGLGAVQEKATLPETHFTLLPQGPNDTGTAHRAPGVQGLVLTALCAFTPGSYEAHTTSAPKQVLDSFAPSSQAPLGGGGGLQKSQAWRAVSRGGPPAASPLARPGHRSTQPRAITIFF